VYVQRALEVEHLFLRELCKRNLEGGLLYWGPWRMCKGGLWRQHLRVGHTGEPGRGLVYWGRCKMNEGRL